MLTRDRQYAVTIFQQIADDVENQPRGYQKKYGAMAHKLPVLVRSAGLAQALGYVQSRGSEEQKKLLDHIAAVVNEQDLLSRSRIADLPEYMRLTRNVLAALVWYKRFALSVLKVESGDEGDGDDTERGNE